MREVPYLLPPEVDCWFKAERFKEIKYGHSPNVLPSPPTKVHKVHQSLNLSNLKPKPLGYMATILSNSSWALRQAVCGKKKASMAQEQITQLL